MDIGTVKEVQVTNKQITTLFIFLMIIWTMIVGPNLISGESVTKYYENGKYAIYSINTILVGHNPNFPQSAGTQKGTLEFNTVENNIVLILKLNNGVQKTINLKIKDSKIYYKNTQTILPFFYTGSKVISHFGRLWENITSVKRIWGNSYGGPANGQSLVEVTTSTNKKFFSNGSSTGELQFDSDKHLLVEGGYSSFNILSAKIINATYYNNTYYIQTLHLIKTNIDLGSPNYGGLILVTLIMSWPIIIGGIFIIVVLLIHNKSIKNNKKPHNHRGGRYKKSKRYNSR